MSRTLVITNDFPTRRGGIETFVWSLVERFPADEVVVYTASMPGDRAFDDSVPVTVLRDPDRMLLPRPAVAKRVQGAFVEHGCDRVLFGASAPLGLLAPGLRRLGAERIVALTHGHEVWWARTPGARHALRRIGEHCDVLTYVSDWCRDQIAPALTETAVARMRPLSPGVDPERFRPDCGGDLVRSMLGISGTDPVVVCTARMVARKGQDTLVRVWPRVLAQVPSARLLLVGGGPRLAAITEAAASLPSVHVVGSRPWAEIPAYTDAGDVFAMPCRTRLGGLEPEAYGIVFLEAAACGLPVVVGASGGAPETVMDGESGYVVDPTDDDAVCSALVDLLSDPALSRRMGQVGRDWAGRHSWDAAAAEARRLLAGP